MFSTSQAAWLAVLALVAFDGHRPRAVSSSSDEEPSVFAPGIVSTDAVEYSITFSPDGATLYFTRRPGPWGGGKDEHHTIYTSYRQDDRWTTPQVAPFSGIYDDADPFLSPDGQRFFFTSNRPVKPGGIVRQDRDIWVMYRTEAGWNEPVHLPPPVNTGGEEYSPVVTAKGTLYFASVRPEGLGQGDLYASPYVADAYRQVFPLAAPINSPRGEWNVGVDPAERFLLFEASQRPENLSSYGDLYLAYRQADGAWGPPMNLRRINTTGSNLMPRIGPDGTYLFYGNTERLDSPDADILRTELAPLLDAYRASAGPEVLLVANRSGHNVALVDPETYTVLGTLPVGQGPHEVVVSPSGAYVYVANYGMYPDVPEQIAPRALRWKREVTNTLTVLDVERRAVVGTHTLEDCTNPHGIATGPDGRRLWVTCENQQALLELDAATGTPLRRWATRQPGSHIVLHDDTRRQLFVANTEGGSVTVIDYATDQVDVVPTGPGAEGLALTPDGSALWVLNARANTISIVNPETHQVEQTLSSGGRFPVKVAITPDGAEAWVVHNASREITIFDVQSDRLLETIALDTAPLGLLLSPDGTRAFVTTPRNDAVLVFDVARRRLLHTFHPGLEPDGMAWLRRASKP